jgi:recombination protein RecT
MTDTNIVTTDQQEPPIVVLRARLEKRREELRKAWIGIDPDKFISVLTTSARINPKLQACRWESMWLACMKACRNNLLPDGVEGAIVPYKDEATWIPMYRGLLKLFRQSGECKWITANVVRKNEVFEHWIDQTGEHFKHIPGTSDNVSPVERVYAAALTKDDAFYVAVLSMAEINKIRAMSRASREDSPWQQWTDEMMKKTALRRLSKLLPAGPPISDSEDEEESPPLFEPSLAISNERAPGAASALDAFAGTGNPPLESDGGSQIDLLKEEETGS